MAAAPAAPDAATAVGRVHVPLGEDGAGEYTLSTLGCFDVIRAAEPLALAALDAVPAPPAAAPVTLVDYGAADAGTSLPLVHALCGRARARWPDREIAVCYEDQPTNEWRSVFGYSQGRLRLPGVPCFAEDFRDPGVFVLACGTGFHEQGFPSGSVDLGVSFTAMHWLSRLPCHLTGGPIHHTQAADPGEAAAFAEQAARDWDRILEARARELRPGGRMVVANFCVDGDGRHLGNTGGGTANMYAVMARLWGELAERGRITEAERRDCTLCNYYRTEEEVRRPFQPGGAAAEAGLKLLTCETRVTPCRYREDWLAQQRGAAGGGGGGGGARTPASTPPRSLGRCARGATRRSWAPWTNPAARRSGSSSSKSSGTATWTSWRRAPRSMGWPTCTASSPSRRRGGAETEAPSGAAQRPFRPRTTTSSTRRRAPARPACNPSALP